MGCGAATAGRYLTDLQPLDKDAASGSSATANTAPPPELAPEPQEREAATPERKAAAGKDKPSPTSHADPHKTHAEAAQREPLSSSGNKKSSEKKSRVAKDIEGAKRWTKQEFEQLSVLELVRWLEALSTDTSSAVPREKAIARLWHEIQVNRPPALQTTVQQKEHLDWWPVQELLRWLEYFSCDKEVANHPMLVHMLMSHGEDLPPPAFLGESAESEYLTLVQRHIGLVKDEAQSLLTELAREITEVETKEWKEHRESNNVWMATGLCVAAFKTSDAQTEDNNAQGKQESHFLDVASGAWVDVLQRHESGWAWCISAEGRGAGYVPSTSVIDVAQALDLFGAAGDTSGVLPIVKDEWVEVLIRHYSGWSLCRKLPSGYDSEERQGWVPDTLLSEHPRCRATKSNRLILTGLHNLAQDAYGVEASFYKLRTAEKKNEDGALEALYRQVLVLIEEYKSICEKLEENASTPAVTEPENKKRRKKVEEDIVPEWVFVDSKCLWTSQSQGTVLPVTVRKVCRKRNKVLVVFDDTPTHNKVIEFYVFENMATCPLRPRTSEWKRQRSARRRHSKGEALQALEKMGEALASDMRGMLDDLGPVENVLSSRSGALRASANDLSGSSGSDSDSSDLSDTTAASTAAPPEAASDPSTQHSARFGKDGSPTEPKTDEAQRVPTAEEEEANRVAAAAQEEEARLAAAAAEEEEARLVAEEEREAKREEASVRLQAAWRGRMGRQAAKARLAEVTRERQAADAKARLKAEARQSEAATLIQSRFRGNQARQRTTALREDLAAAEAAAAAEKAAAEAAAAAEKAAAEAAAAQAQAAAEVAAATRIQAAARGKAARRRVECQRRKVEATMILRRAVHGTFHTWKTRAYLAELRRERDAKEAEAALIIQRNARGYIGRREARSRFAEREEMKKISGESAAAKVIQGVCRGYLRRLIMADLQFRYDSATRIQARWKGGHQRQIQRPRIAEWTRKRAASALVIQAAFRGVRERRRIAEEKRTKGVPATKIQSVWRGQRTRRVMRPLIARRALCAVRIQSRWRGTRGRIYAGIVAQEPAAIRMQSALRTLAAKARLAELRRERAEMLASIVIQTAWRGVLGRQRVAKIRRDRAELRSVLQIQPVWRGALGRMKVMELRVEEATSIIDALMSGEAADLKSRDATWLQKVLGALEFKERRDEADKAHELEMRRRTESSRLPQDAKLTAHRLSCAMAMERGLAAAWAARVRVNLRSRAVLTSLVGGDADVSCDATMAAALQVNEGILVRLAADDASNEVASVLAAAWAITASSAKPGRRPPGTPAPFEVLSSGVNSLHGRLTAECCGEQHVPLEEDPESAKATKDELSKAERRAYMLRQSALAPIRAEISSIRETGPLAIQRFKEAADRVPAEVKELQEKRAVEIAEAERKLREERETKHAQTQALHDIALRTQIEKERLEGALYTDNVKGLQVFSVVHTNVKILKQELTDLDVSGASNRKNKGILEHTLRALEVRAVKAGGDSQEAKKGDYTDNYVPSEQVKKKQEKRDEQEQEFREALEAEVATLKRGFENQLTYEAAELGARLRAEAEVYAKEAADVAQRLRVWRNDTEALRPWLGVLQPLARAKVMISRAAKRIKKQRESQASLGPVVRGVLPVIEALKKDLTNANSSETPRADDVQELAASLADTQRKAVALLKTYPDPEAAPESHRSFTRRSTVSSENIDDGELPVTEHLVHPGKLRANDAMDPPSRSKRPRARAQSGNESTPRTPKAPLKNDGSTPRTPKSDDVGADAITGAPKKAPKRDGPQRGQSRVLEKARAGLASFAGMGTESNALAEKLGGATTPPEQPVPRSHPAPPSRSAPSMKRSQQKPGKQRAPADVSGGPPPPQPQPALAAAPAPRPVQVLGPPPMQNQNAPAAPMVQAMGPPPTQHQPARTMASQVERKLATHQQTHPQSAPAPPPMVQAMGPPPTQHQPGPTLASQAFSRQALPERAESQPSTQMRPSPPPPMQAFSRQMTQPEAESQPHTQMRPSAPPPIQAEQSGPPPKQVQPQQAQATPAEAPVKRQRPGSANSKRRRPPNEALASSGSSSNLTASRQNGGAGSQNQASGSAFQAVRAQNAWS